MSAPAASSLSDWDGAEPSRPFPQSLHWNRRGKCVAAWNTQQELAPSIGRVPEKTRETNLSRKSFGPSSGSFPLLRKHKEIALCDPDTAFHALCWYRGIALSTRQHSKRKRILARRNIGYLNFKALCSPPPFDFGLRPKQFDFSNLSRKVFRILCERPDENLPVRWPAQGDGIERFAFGGESNVCMVELELSELVTQLLVCFCRRAFAKDLPGTRALDCLSVHLLPFRKFIQEGKLVTIRLSMTRQRDTKQEIPILADDVHEKRNNGRSLLVRMVFKETQVVVPISDAHFCLPRLFLQPFCHAKLKVASEGAPHRLRNFLEVDHSF